MSEIAPLSYEQFSKVLDIVSESDTLSEAEYQELIDAWIDARSPEIDSADVVWTLREAEEYRLVKVVRLWIGGTDST